MSFGRHSRLVQFFQKVLILAVSRPDSSNCHERDRLPSAVSHIRGVDECAQCTLFICTQCQIVSSFPNHCCQELKRVEAILLLGGPCCLLCPILCFGSCNSAGRRTPHRSNCIAFSLSRRSPSRNWWQWKTRWRLLDTMIRFKKSMLPCRNILYSALSVIIFMFYLIVSFSLTVAVVQTSRCAGQCWALRELELLVRRRVLTSVLSCLTFPASAKTDRTPHFSNWESFPHTFYAGAGPPKQLPTSWSARLLLDHRPPLYLHHYFFFALIQ